ncbi:MULTISPECIES: hypothetical protein [Roseomonadaceae]|uniref:NAD synthetase n=1 Tax=Falsiroseomonas oleicola TaxID=2801474 RepID=A0ABS6H6R3_9PROT|nr:hypothetical protein [Roseomonas oleicola]MBU8544389.1 hypothetical protein [Roseomonas oleicola]
MTDAGIRSLLADIDRIPNFRGLGVILVQDDKARMLRKPTMCSVGADYILIELQSRPSSVPQAGGRGIFVEGGLAALNCTAAVFASLLTFGSATAAPVTGGSSLVITTVSYAATTAAGLSCGVAAMRTYNEVMDPQANVRLDEQAWYARSMAVVDGVTLLGVGASVATASRLLGTLSRSGVKLGPALAGSVERQARARMVREAARGAQANISNGSIKALQASGQLPKRLTNTEISSAAVTQLKDAVAAGLSFTASGLDGHVKGVAVYLLEMEQD